MADNKGVGYIDLHVEGVSLEETERLRLTIHTLFQAGAFNVKNGRAILHFDSLGILQMVEKDFISWRRPKAQP